MALIVLLQLVWGGLDHKLPLRKELHKGLTVWRRAHDQLIRYHATAPMLGPVFHVITKQNKCIE